MFMKKPKHRIFDYEPRFYKPELDEDEKRKRKLNFRSNRISKRKMKTPYVWIGIVLVILYFILKTEGML